jgi:eukaryotic-like serine/threonine-protein kinase
MSSTAGRATTDVRFGDYVLCMELGRGGSGVVYRARRAGSDESVALKVMIGGELATPEQRDAFLAGPRSAAGLRHPNIAPIREFGEHAGQPYFTMDLIEGTSLAETIEEGRATRAEILDWLEHLASAVSHAHRARVLHRDLKPANILLDRENVPHLLDFGSAKQLEDQGACSNSDRAWLTPYMAPEQARGERGGSAVDIYSLGVICYELLTGLVPYEALDFGERVAALTSSAPIPPPRKLDPSVDRNLELIALRCLEKDPKRRYGSAEALLEDVRLVRAGERPKHAYRGRLERAARWLGRHPLVSVGAGAIAFVLMSFLVVTGWLVVAEQERELRAAALGMNQFAARAEAGSMLYRLRLMGDELERIAASPTARRCASSPRWLQPAPPDFAELIGGFGSIAIATTEGKPIARHPPVPDWYENESFAHRDFFKGAQRLGLRGERGVHVARAYRSRADGVFKFALAAPIFDEERFAGVMLASVVTDSKLGLSPVRAGTTDPVIALIGPRDVEDRGVPQPEGPLGYNLLVHPALGRGRELTLGPEDARFLHEQFDETVTPNDQFEVTPRSPPAPASRGDYRDPLLGGRWLAAFAPVGGTGYVVLVESKVEMVGAPTTRLVWRLAAGFGLAALLLLVLVSLAARLGSFRAR